MALNPARLTLWRESIFLWARTMSIAAEERRLTAMLEELERGMRRSRAMDKSEGSNPAKIARPIARIEGPHQMTCELKEQLSPITRAAAIVFVIGGLVWISPSLVSWSKGPGSSETGTAKSEIELAKLPAETAIETNAPTKDARNVEALAHTLSVRPANNAKQPVDGTREQQKAPYAVALDKVSSLSAEEYNVLVRRLMAQKRAGPHGAAARSEALPDGTLLPSDTPSSALREAIPVTPPPTTASPTTSKPEMTATVEPPPAFSIPVEIRVQSRDRHAPIAKKSNARATARITKPKRGKVGSKRAETPALNSTPTPASSGPIGFIQGTTEALTGVLQNWGRIAAGSRP
jgi:hypothetical protein